MIDLSKIPADEMARQLGSPQSDIGIAVAQYMNRLNRNLTEAAYQLLKTDQGNHVLEIGFGNGHLIPLLLKTTEDIYYSGIDASPTMVAEAIKANQSLIDAGRADIRLASVESLPFANSTFDRAIGINTMYFWPDPVKGLKDLLRVLKPSGCLVLACISPETAALTPTMKTEFGVNVFDKEKIISLHKTAGFTKIDIINYDEMGQLSNGKPLPRRCYLSRAELC